MLEEVKNNLRCSHIQEGISNRSHFQVIEVLLAHLEFSFFFPLANTFLTSGRSRRSHQNIRRQKEEMGSETPTENAPVL